MAKRGPMSFAKRQREMNQKQRALEKRRKRDQKKDPNAPVVEEPMLRCMPIVDDAPPT